MKKLLPFLFPLFALVIVFIVGLRWYTSQTSSKQGQISDIASDSAQVTTVDPLSQTDATRLRQPGSPAKDTNTVQMKGSQPAQGEIRYEVKNGQVLISVIANLPKPTQGVYQVWLRTATQKTPTQAFVLELDKGGYVGSGAVSADLLPIEVTVTNHVEQPNQPELPLLSGSIQREVPVQNQ